MKRTEKILEQASKLEDLKERKDKKLSRKGRRFLAAAKKI